MTTNPSQTPTAENLRTAWLPMLSLAPRLFQEGSGSVSPSVYWWRPERGFLLLPVGEVDRHPAFFPPDELVEMLNEVAGAGS
jgi:hypothetical protein